MKKLITIMALVAAIPFAANAHHHHHHHHHGNFWGGFAAGALFGHPSPAYYGPYRVWIPPRTEIRYDAWGRPYSVVIPGYWSYR